MSEDAPVNTDAAGWPDENTAYFAVRRMQTKLHGWAGADASRRFDDPRHWNHWASPDQLPRDRNKLWSFDLSRYLGFRSRRIL